MTSTIAARCAAMSSAIAQIIVDASYFARQLRESRHYINYANADLLAIKLSLDIARDDFSAPGTGSFPLLVEAMAEFLDCCCTTTESLHKLIIRLSAIRKQAEGWNMFYEGDSQMMKQDLEALRSALDLVLDLVVLLPNHKSFRSSSFSSMRRCVGGRSPDLGDPFLKRVDIEREHMATLTEGRLPILYASVDKLRAFAKVILMDEKMPVGSKKRTDSRSDSLEPDMENDSRLQTSEAKQPHHSSMTASNKIGAWIANVLSQKLNPHSLPPDISIPDPRTNSRPKAQEQKQDQDLGERTPSRGTFYSESTSSGTLTQSPGLPRSPRPSHHLRADSPLLEEESTISKPHRLTQCTATTEGSIIDQNLTNDKMAIAKGRRKQLSRSQRATVDSKLRDIACDTAVVNVERMFFEGADPNVSHPDFGTLAIRAAYEFPTDILRLLLDYGADITKTAKTLYYSTLHAAVMGRNLETLQYLLSFSTSASRFSSIEPVPPTPCTPKFLFPTSGNIIFAVDTPNAYGETPLHIATRTPGAYDIAKWLVERGADVNREVPNGGGTPLQIAVSKLDSRERSAMVELLMAYGAEGCVEGECAGNGVRGERRGKGLSVLGLI